MILGCNVYLSSFKRAFSYGKHYRADFVLEILDKQVFQIKHKDKILGPFKVNLWGEHNLYNSGAVVSVGYLLGISNDVMARAFSSISGSGKENGTFNKLGW